MILCQTCLGEAPDGSAACPACGEPLATPVGLPRPVRNTLLPTNPRPDLGQGAAPLAPVLPPPAWHPTAPTNGHPPAVTASAGTEALGFQFPSGQLYMLSGKRTYVIGRADAASGVHPDLDLTAEGAADAGVSRRHAAIYLRSDGVFIEDLGSANETLLNGQRLLPRQPYPLHPGDQVRFGLLNALVVGAV